MRCPAIPVAIFGALLAIGPAVAEPAAGERIQLAQLFGGDDDRPFLLRLFGGRRDDDPARRPKILRVPESGGAAAQRPQRTRPAQNRKVQPKKPAVIDNPKNADAKQVMVVGDRLADALARGLDVAFADTPTLKVVDAAVSPSGLADPSRTDWSAALPARLAADDPPDAVVVMLGSDDRVPLMVDGVETGFRLPAWETVYEARIRAVIEAARSRQIPIYWTGLVPMAEIEMTTDMAYLDELYRRVAAENFARYIDVWNAFADETGSFTASGPDIAGQVRQLRLKDGVGFTKSGSRKLAFHVEQELRAWLKSGAPGGPALPDETGEGGLVLSLADPEAGPDEELAGAGPPPPPKAGSALHDLIVLGRPLPPRVGRVDDLSTN